ncbi:hypothetical protein [Singulisphaera sp. PoT]|uniref:hypothetical protein n=1 Tax=Singulisphaera sp. PoT TaxID=3411797 RepID=UPI003BF52D2A
MLTLLLSLASLSALADGPIELHPENPHYLRYQGRTTVLVTSGEHYGSVLNLDFDFIPYLDALKASGLNMTRLFSGTYREVPGSFNIKENNLAPAPGRYLPPWIKVGEDKYDLDRFNPAYFDRLKQFLRAAEERGIVVEYVFFCPFYEDVLWDIDPMNAKHNVNGVGAVPGNEVFTLKHPELVARHEAFVRKVVAELKDVNNLYYEVCNEPYFGGVTREWQDRIIATIIDAEKVSLKKHLIAQNIANDKAKIESPNPAVSIFNFHYATPPDTVAMNYELKRPLGDDETGFRKTGDLVYRVEGWEFMLAGGAIYNNLDYSFSTTHADGTAEVSDPTPGGGGPRLRKQLGILKRFLDGFDLLRMAPDITLIRGGVPDKVTPRVLAEAGKQYAVYLSGGKRVSLEVDLPAGAYHAEWLDTRSGEVVKVVDLEVKEGSGLIQLNSPDFEEDIALRIMARGR